MVEWKPISELFDIEKGTLQSSKCRAGTFAFVTAAEEWKTHESFTHDCEALIFAMAASGSLGRTHYVNGKFIASDLCFILTPRKGIKLDLMFYFRLFNFLRSNIVKTTSTGTSKLAINQTNFGAYRIPYFDFDHQLLFRNKIERINEISQNFDAGLNEQLALLKQLRQIILQEAIEGKLTANWRKEHPDLISGGNHASKLLAKIKAEKELLIKKNMIKAGKKQDPYNQDITFDIPREWVRADLDDITQTITDGTHQTPSYVNNGKPFLSAQNVKPFKFMPDDCRYVTEQAFWEYTKSTKAEKGDLLVGRVGSRGETAVIDSDLEFAFYVSLGLVKTFKRFTVPYFLACVMNSPYGYSYASKNMSSLGASAGNFNLGHIRAFPIPLPSLCEQNIIVERVEKLMMMIGNIEKQVAERKQQAEMLIQSVLYEAFQIA